MAGEEQPDGATEDVPRSLDAMVAPPAGLTEARAATQRERVGAQSALTDKFSGRMEEDRARMVKAFEQTGIEPGTLQPWDAAAAREKYRTDPLESFGSLGSVFAMVAAAFTHAPMENALLGGAAAMNAVREGKEKEFDKAYTAWKDNNDLAYKRHNIMQQQYQDATALMSSDVTAGQAQMRMLAAKYDDKQVLALMDAGMDKEVIDLMEKRNKMALETIKISQDATKATFQQAALKTITEANKDIEDPTKRAVQNLSAFNRIYGVKGNAGQEILGQYLFENPGASAEEIATFAQKHGLIPGALGKIPALEQEIQRRKIEYMKPLEEGGMGLSETEADTRARRDVKSSQSASTNNPQAIEIERRKKQYMLPVEDGGLGMSETEAFDRATQEVKATATTLTANKVAEYKTQISQYGHSLDKIDSITGTLDKYTASAGLTGKARRLAERLSNLAGSKQTDLVQMMRDIEYLKAEGSRLLSQSRSRPLASEAGRIDNIIGGMSMGDTVANTLRSMQELKKLYAQMRAETQKLIGEGSPRAGGPGGGGGDEPPPMPASPPPRTAPRWQDAPVVQ